jgi:hypothetical protein
MKSHASHANRLRRRRGVSMSSLQYIERIARLGERAVRRQFVAVDRRAIKEGGICES